MLKFVTLGTLLSIFLYLMISSAFYTAKVAGFYGVDYWSSDITLVMNGSPSPSHGSTIHVQDLLAEVDGVSIKSQCPDVKSEHGDLRLGQWNGKNICCPITNGQEFIPYKNENGRRYYLCGVWPSTSVVSRPLNNVKIDFDSKPPLPDIIINSNES